MDKTVVILSDLHCGSRVGLTPPKWQTEGKFGKVQKETWKFFRTQIAAIGHIDLLIVNGDAIDGKGPRSGSTECISTDRIEQATMAAECINQADADAVIMTYGTGYHVGNEEDWEVILLNMLDVKRKSIEGHSFPNVNGVQFDIKHKVGSSGIPHGRFTAIARSKLWNTVWNNKWELQPNAGIMVRSHVHYAVYCGTPDWLALTTPALQSFGSKYGVRQCEGMVDVGMTHFDITKEGNYKWRYIIGQMPHQKVRPSYF